MKVALIVLTLALTACGGGDANEQKQEMQIITCPPDPFRTTPSEKCTIAIPVTTKASS